MGTLTHCYLTMKLAIFSLLAFVSVCNGFSYHHNWWFPDQRSDPVEKQPGTGDDYGLSLRRNVNGECSNKRFPFFLNGDCCDSRNYTPGICCQIEGQSIICS